MGSSNWSTWPTQSTTPTSSGGDGSAGADDVQVRRPVRSQDASGGRTVAYGAWEPTVLGASIAAVTLKTANIQQFAREGELIKYTVTMNIRLSYRDQILWLETGDILTVVRAMASGTRSSRTWDHLCEELRD